MMGKLNRNLVIKYYKKIRGQAIFQGRVNYISCHYLEVSITERLDRVKFLFSFIFIALYLIPLTVQSMHSVHDVFISNKHTKNLIGQGQIPGANM